MNILILNWKDTKNPEVGGAEIILYEFAKRWIKKGHTVTWFCRSYKGAKPKDVLDGIQIIRRGNKLTTYLQAFLYYRSLRKKPDIVLDVLNTIFWQTPLYVPKEKRIAYVNQLAKEVFWYELPPIISHISFILEKFQFITYRTTPFVTYANSTKGDLINEGIDADQINIFPMGLDENRYKPGKKSTLPLFVCINRLVRMKRTDLVIHAMKSVVKKYPKAQLAIIGYGYARERLGKIRDKLNLQKNVFFVDENILFFKQSKKDKKIDLMQKAWALVFPSVKEGWGMTVTESGACRTPAIVSDVTGLKDSVMGGKTGIIVSKNPSEGELVDAMIRIIKDNKLRNKLSDGALQFSKQFTWEKSAITVLNILQNKINE